MRTLSRVRIFVAAVTVALLSSAALEGCAMLAVGAPGDAGIQYSSQGAKGDVKASPDQVAAVSARVLTAMGIQPLGSSQVDGGWVVTGKGHTDQITIRIDDGGANSHLEVLDFTGNSNWNQDFAAIILLQIGLQFGSQAANAAWIRPEIHVRACT